MRSVLLLLAVATLCVAEPAVTPWQGEHCVVDGKLIEAAWTEGASFSDFTPLASERREQAEVKTEFKMRTDSEGLHIGIECEEPRMKELDLNAVLWIADGVEVFLSPSGNPDAYYQFRVTANSLTYAMYWAESGNITPDPYAPLWQYAVDRRPDGWSVEMMIPWQAFYLTTSAQWKSSWLVNVVRNRRVARQNASWSKLHGAFHESARFRKMSGFPAKKENHDFFIKEASATIEDLFQDSYRGKMSFEIISSRPTTCLLECVGTGMAIRSQVTLNSGSNLIALPGSSFPVLGRNRIQMRLSNSGETYTERFYDVPVEFDPLKIVLFTPQYRDTFYPGQNSDRVRGRVIAGVSGAKDLSVRLDDRPPVTVSFSEGAADFSLETPQLADGRHQLVAEMKLADGQTIRQELKVSKFSEMPQGRMCAWIENGQIILNGKPMIPRFIYAHYYRGGTAFRLRTDADDLGLTGPDDAFRVVNEPKRLIPDIEAREATRDVKPCAELFAKLQASVERNKDRDFLFYYLCDEPECRSVSPVYLRHMYEYLKEADPWHLVLISSRSPARYSDTVDVIVPHPYTGPTFDADGGRYLNVPISSIRDYIRAPLDKHHGDKVAGLMAQVFSYKFNSVFADYPTFEELEAQTWSALANGARCFYYYAYHDLGDRPVLYEGVRYLMTSIRALEEYLVQAKTLPLAGLNPEQKTDAILLENSGTCLLIIVNLLEKPQNMEIHSKALKDVALWHLFRGEGQTMPGRKEALAFSLNPYECVVMSSQPLDSGLSSRSAAIRRISELEAIRVSRPNILFGRGLDLELSSSSPSRSSLGIQNKLFDGTLDVLAWFHSKREVTPYLEMAFPKFVPQFSKLRIFGTPLSRNISVSMRKAGKWLPLTAKTVKQEDFMIEYDFEETLRTIKLRIDFPKLEDSDAQEVYEIELEP